MAGRLTLWGAGEFLRTYVSRTAEPPPTFYLALCLSNPGAYAAGFELDEPLVASYARAAIPNDVDSWTTPDQLHIIANAIDINFITATEDWGRIPYWALCNAEIEGYVLAVGDMESEEYIAATDQVVVEAGEIAIELGPFYTPEDF